MVSTRLLDIADESLAHAGPVLCHEVNNPLAYVVTNLDLTIESLPGMAERLRRLQSRLDQAAAQEHTESDTTAGRLARELAALQEMLSEAREGAERVTRVMRAIKTLAARG